MMQFPTIRSGLIVRTLSLLTLCLIASRALSADRLMFEPVAPLANKHIVLISGDEEYRTEESMPMLGKILSQKHGFRCTVLFSLGPDGADYIDSNNSAGLRGLDSLDQADLMIIGTRFRNPDAAQGAYITKFLNAGKPVIGIRTATHAFKGKGSFGSIAYDDFGLKVLGETWVSHHGGHKVEGCRGVIESNQASHPILRGVRDLFVPTDVYGVKHLTDSDTVLMRAAVTKSLDPKSENVTGPKNESPQAFAWLHNYSKPDGNGMGRAFCTTGGGSVDFLNEGMRRLVVNASFFLTDREVPAMADVNFVDPFHPSFYGFIQDTNYWKNANMKPDDFGLGKTPKMQDPPGTPTWRFDGSGNR